MWCSSSISNFLQKARQTHLTGLLLTTRTEKAKQNQYVGLKIEMLWTKPKMSFSRIIYICSLKILTATPSGAWSGSQAHLWQLLNWLLLTSNCANRICWDLDLFGWVEIWQTRMLCHMTISGSPKQNPSWCEQPSWIMQNLPGVSQSSETFDQYNCTPKTLPGIGNFSHFEKDSCVIFVKNNISSSQLSQIVPPKETHKTYSYKCQYL